MSNPDLLYLVHLDKLRRKVRGNGNCYLRGPRPLGLTTSKYGYRPNQEENATPTPPQAPTTETT